MRQHIWSQKIAATTIRVHSWAQLIRCLSKSPHVGARLYVITSLVLITSILSTDDPTHKSGCFSICWTLARLVSLRSAWQAVPHNNHVLLLPKMLSLLVISSSCASTNVKSYSTAIIAPSKQSLFLITVRPCRAFPLTLSRVSTAIAMAYFSGIASASRRPTYLVGWTVRTIWRIICIFVPGVSRSTNCLWDAAYFVGRSRNCSMIAREYAVSGTEL